MKKIPLSVTNKWKHYKDNLFALVDDKDYDLLKDRKWYFSDGYARTTLPQVNGKKKHISMHRMILGITDSKIKTDHKNHNGLDNRRENIRICTHQENLRNKTPSKTGTSKYLGVCIQKREINGRPYSYIVATIKMNGKHTWIGTFKTEVDAARAYDAAAKIHHGEFANLNFK